MGMSRSRRAGCPAQAWSVAEVLRVYWEDVLNRARRGLMRRKTRRSNGKAPGGERMAKHIKVLFLCTGNSCRSQMAEGWTKALKGDVIDAYSAGVEPHGMNENAIRVMREAGVDINSHHSKHLDELKHVPFDYVVTVCDHAHETCPLFTGATKVLHVGFDDPPHLAKAATSEQDVLNIYRRVRDEIRAFVLTLPDALTKRDSR